VKTPTKIPNLNLIYSNPEFANLARLLRDLNARWEPHDGQRAVGEKIFVEGARRVFIECGRKWGKSEFAVDLCWRFGNMIKGGQIYYYGAYQKAVREFIWAPQRLQLHGPREYVKEINKNEMRLTWTTDTFVKCDGADEFKIGKGFQPDVVILDEYADYNPDFWTAMSPNYAPKDTIVIIISSPPWLLESSPGEPVHFIKMADLWAKYQEEAYRLNKNPKYVYINQPTHTNPHISKEWLIQEEKDLRGMGQDDVWEREYLAKRVSGRGKRVIPTFDKTVHMVQHEELMARLKPQWDELTWATIVDPGSSADAAFGGLILAVNPYNGEAFFLDEVYEKDESRMTEHFIWPVLKEKEDDVYPSDDEERFLRIYDEAAKWFATGVLNEFGVTFQQTAKATNDISQGITLLVTGFYRNKIWLSTRCEWFAWELENYIKDKFGRPSDKNNHQIDTSRYGLHALDFALAKENRPEKEKDMHLKYQRKACSMADDFIEYGDLAHSDPLGGFISGDYD
jgi:hypothetical protein